MFKVYLAGFINGTKIVECTEWRKRIAQYYLLKGWEIIWLDPMNGKAVSTLTPDGLKTDIPGSALLDRDIKCVEEADLIIVNLNTFGETRAPTGTICELAIAGYLRKPVIVITDDFTFKEHPFVQEFASVIVKSVDELLERKLVDYFYRGTVSARYE
jgi:hypothetical protein